LNSTPKEKELLIIGCGYTGRRIAAELLEKKKPVTGVVSTGESARQLEQLGATAVVADLDRSDLELPLEGHDQIFYLAPPPGEGTADTRLKGVLAQLRSQELSPRIVYTSTTGVYGDCQGEWVTEDRPLNPTTDRARRRADAEKQLISFTGEAVILRVAGIYGPGRLPLDRVRSGAPVLRPEDSPFSNRIHVNDLVSICLAAMDRGRPGQAYNVADGTPGTMAQYFTLLAELIGAPAPPAMTWAQAEQAMPPGLMSYLRENRRMDIRKLREELGVALKYPHLEDGMRASLDEDI
jgi:nucleoside-diphosphate-sugar epimerase